MRIPGFTAEAALHWKSLDYQGVRQVLRGRGTVEPAFWWCHGNVCCTDWGYCIYRGHVLM